MLYPIPTETRSVMNLNGIWRFKFDPVPGRIGGGFEARYYERRLDGAVSMPVPSAWNDLFEEQADRDFVGWVWYEKEFSLRELSINDNLILRFGSATHRAKVYLNGRHLMEHSGGFTPFEAIVDDFIVEGANRLTVAVCNILDYSTLPIGTYTEREIPGVGLRPVNTPNFDFFNYAGLQRSIVLYTVPRTRVEDIVIVADYAGDTGVVDYAVTLTEEDATVDIQVLNQDGTVIVSSRLSAGHGEAKGRLLIPNVVLWNPRAAYLYEFRVSVSVGGERRDVYTESFGVRRVEVRDGRFLLNEKPFYFKGFGKHEDANLRGRGLDEVINVKDLRLIKWMGGNSLRTSHYCYSEEFMRLCDREGIVVIDEVPAVGLMLGFNFDVFSMMDGSRAKPKTWEAMQCGEAHRNVVREMIERDKNHPCVVMWSVANESEAWTQGAREYFEPIFDMARTLDPGKRPVTAVLIQGPDIAADQLAPLSDVICINRYYGWYAFGGNLKAAMAFLSKELADWTSLYPDKPILLTEYGADTVAGLHDTADVMFTEEYQRKYYEANHEIFDQYPNVVGEQAWNFADFATSQGVLRVQGNKKGLFTRERKPKQAVFALKTRWEAIPDFGYVKDDGRA